MTPRPPAPEIDADQVRERLRAVRRRIADLDADPDRLDIVAVTKFHDVSACRAAVAAGLTTLGENRVQEALGKMDLVTGAAWHLLGHLQTNKVRQAERFDLVQSLDSRRLVDALASKAPAVPVLLEINIAEEAAKTGADPVEAPALAAYASGRLDLRGVMGMGPREGDPRPAFRRLRELKERIEDDLGRRLPILSMGMTADFEAAVQEGSTMLRLGTVLFGPRAPVREA